MRFERKSFFHFFFFFFFVLLLEYEYPSFVDSDTQTNGYPNVNLDPSNFWIMHTVNTLDFHYFLHKTRELYRIVDDKI